MDAHNSGLKPMPFHAGLCDDVIGVVLTILDTPTVSSVDRRLRTLHMYVHSVSNLRDLCVLLAVRRDNHALQNRIALLQRALRARFVCDLYVWPLRGSPCPFGANLTVYTSPPNNGAHYFLPIESVELTETLVRPRSVRVTFSSALSDSDRHTSVAPLIRYPRFLTQIVVHEDYDTYSRYPIHSQYDRTVRSYDAMSRRRMAVVLRK